MLQNLRFALLYGAYLRNEHGIKKFAEMSMGQLIRRVTKKSAAYREMIETLQVEKANLRMRRDELYERPTLDGGRFFSSQQQYWTNQILVALIVTAATFLNELAIRTLLEPDTFLGEVFSWLVAILVAVVLTGGGMVAASRLVAVLILPVNENPEHRRNRTLRAAMWGSLLVIVELTVLGLAEVQASALVAQGSRLLYLSYIIGALALPLIAGALRWHNMRFIDPYKTTLALRRVESRLAQIDSTLRQSEEYESNFYKIKSIEYWDQVNAFKTLKDNRNKKEGVVEPLGGHFAQSYNLFQAEANKRFMQDIRDITTYSMRKLELLDEDKTVGRKIGQHNGDSARPSPAPETPDYLGLKPVR